MVSTAGHEPLQFSRFIGAAASGGRTDVRIELSHSGAFGCFGLRIEPRPPGAQLAVLREEDITNPLPLRVDGTAAAGEIVPSGAKYVLTLIDLIGRASTPLRPTPA